MAAFLFNMIFRRKRVLVTGLSGFTGRYLRSALLNYNIDILGFSGNRTDRELNILKIDLQDINALKNAIQDFSPDCVVHLAAISSVVYDNIDEYYKVNVIGTNNLLHALSEYNITKKLHSVLIAGSANVYGNSDASKLQEDMQCFPVSDYAKSKYEMEKVSASWLDCLPITVVRPFNYTGIGQSHDYLIPKIIAAFKSKQDTVSLGNIQVYREFLDVRDVVSCYLSLMEISPCETINIFCGQPYSIEQIIEVLKKLTGHGIEVEINRKFVRKNEINTLKGDPKRLFEYVPNFKFRDLNKTLVWMMYKDDYHI